MCCRFSWRDYTWVNILVDKMNGPTTHLLSELGERFLSAIEHLNSNKISLKMRVNFFFQVKIKMRHFWCFSNTVVWYLGLFCIGWSTANFPFFRFKNYSSFSCANWQINFGYDRQFEFIWRPIVIWWSWQKWFSGQFNSSIFRTLFIVDALHGKTDKL